MEMKEVFENLKELQDVLSEKYSIEAQIDEAPKSLTTQDEDLHLKKKEFIVKSAAYEEKRKTVGNLKAELAEAEAARERGEKGMDSITTHREYEALQKEIDDATNLEQKIRKDLQREEKNLAELDEALEHDKQIIDSSEAELNAGKEALDAKVNIADLNENHFVVSDGTISLKESYVTTGLYQAEVGDLSKLMHSALLEDGSINENSTLVDEVNYINERLTWIDMNI